MSLRPRHNGTKWFREPKSSTTINPHLHFGRHVDTEIIKNICVQLCTFYDVCLMECQIISTLFTNNGVQANVIDPLYRSNGFM